MILKADVVASCLEKPDSADPLVITPSPNIEVLKVSGAASVDLRLGTWFLSLRHAKMTCIDVTKGEDYHEASEKFTKSSYIPFGEDFILHPGSFVLGITLEWIRLPGLLSGFLIGKSSWGRRGLVIATATGVHPGFTGCLTLEITNLGHIPVRLKPGMPICQLFLEEVRGSPSESDLSQFNGRRKPVLGKMNIDHFSKMLSEEI